MERAEKIHIMVIPFPAQGHMNPMMQFSKRLASKGLRVTVVAISNTSKSINPQPSSVNIEYLSESYEEDTKADSLDDYLAKIELHVSQKLPELIQKQKHSGHPPVKALVYDSVMPWIGEISRRLRLPGGPFFTQACVVCAIFYHVHQGTVKRPPEESTVSLPSMPVLEISDLPSAIYDMAMPSAALKMLADQFLDLHKADWILLNTFDELENEILKWMATQWSIKTIGPTIPSMYLDKRLTDDKDYGLSLFKPDAEGCIEWLDAKSTGSVVYVSFGSVARLGQDHMDEVAWGLLRTNSYFLWVVRDSEHSKLPTGFMAEAGEKGLVVGWCPQLEVLAHQAVGSFMTHCGWNSTIEALSLGVPMLVMPQWMDQTTNAKYVVDVWKTGVRVKEIVTREEIAVSINDVMVGAKRDELRANAVRWKELTIEAMQEGGSSHKNIEEFVSELNCINLNL